MEGRTYLARSIELICISVIAQISNLLFELTVNVGLHLLLSYLDERLAGALEILASSLFEAFNAKFPRSLYDFNIPLSNREIVSFNIIIL